MDVNHAIEQRRRHRLDNRRILRAIARSHHNRTGRQAVFAEFAVVNQRIERFLHFARTRVEFIQKQAISLVARNRARRAKAAFSVDNLRHTDQIFGRELTAEQRNALQTQRARTSRRAPICRCRVAPK